MIEKKLDAIDRRLLDALQQDCAGTTADIAERVGLSQTPCWRRIKKLEEAGYIDKRVALLNADKLNLPMVAFVLIKTDRHDQAWLESFSKGTADIPEIVEIHRMAGEIDYLLKVILASVEDYDRIYRKLIQVTDLSNVTASFSMERIKMTTALPINP